MFEGICLGLGLLVSVAIGNYLRIRSKGWNLLAAGGLLFLFSATWSAPAVSNYLYNITILKDGFELVGWLLVLMGSLFVAYDLLSDVF